MTNFKEIDTLIESYRSGTMSSEDRLLFEERLKTDTDLRKAYKLHEELDGALEDTDAFEFEKVIESVVLEKRTGTWKTFLYLLSIIGLGIFVYYMLTTGTTKKDHDKLFADHYEVYEILGVQRAGDEASEQWMELYANGQYEVVIEQLETDNDLTDVETFYLAQSLLAAGRLDEALIILDDILETDGHDFQSHAQWYKALILIKKGKQGQATRLLQGMEEQRGRFGQSSKKLLKDLTQEKIN